jgi:hypothetical protein
VVLVEQQIAGLDVAVDDAAACAASSAPASTAIAARCRRSRKPAFSRSPTVRPIAPLTMKTRPSLADVVDRHDVRMRRKAGGSAHFALEPRRARRPARCRASTLTATERPRIWSSASQTPAIPPFAKWRTTT